MKSAGCAVALALGVVLAGCGDDQEAVDGGGNPADAAGSADAPPGAACDEFTDPAATLSSYPAEYTGDTVGAGADLQVGPGVCTDERNWHSQAGDDQVVLLTGLTAGTRYGVKTVSATDLSLYVATGCNPNLDGPGTGQCLLFVDQAFGNEFGDFVAPDSGEVTVVVDHYDTIPVDTASFTLSVYQAACTGDDECSGDTPFCHQLQCVACATDFDCTDPADPVCIDTTNTCGPGYSICVDDDPAENGDDGPAGATALAPSVGVPDLVQASICSSPAAELDYYQFTVTDGESRAVALDWAGDSADLDLALLDDQGNLLDNSYNDQPESVRGDDLDAGTYYVRVHQYAPSGDSAVTDYTLTAAVPECDSSFHCTEVAAPVCSAAYLCVAGPAQCTGDDGVENGDDGPAGATAVSYTYDTASQVTGHVCSAPASERDFYSVEVADGDDLTVTLHWTDSTQDLDLFVYDAVGRLYGYTLWTKPEVVTLTNLPAGTVYLSVEEYSYSGPETAAVEYVLDVLVSAGGCATVADCAAEYDTQIFRGDCGASGACQFLDGAGAIANGAACDSDDDCDSGICSYILFESDAADSVCTVACSADTDCTDALGSGYRCTYPFDTDFCHPGCTEDTDCGADPETGFIDPDQPWSYYTCTGGACFP